MSSTVLKHLERAGWPVTIPYVAEKSVYNVDGKEGIIVTFRSQDIPLEVGQIADVGIVGSDWVKERQLEFPRLDIKILTEFDSYGREFGTKPKLQLIAFGSNPVSEPGQIPAGTIIRTEQPYLTREFLMENFGFEKVEIMGEIMGKNSHSFQKPQEFVCGAGKRELLVFAELVANLKVLPPYLKKLALQLLSMKLGEAY